MCIRDSSRLDEVILRCTVKRLTTLPSFLKLNGDDAEEFDEAE